MVVLTFAPLMRLALSLAFALPGERPVTAPATAVPPEYFKKSRLEIPIFDTSL
jgi:hypothetical protein